MTDSSCTTIDRELIDTRPWPMRAGLGHVFEHIEGRYTTRRSHSSLGYVSVAQYEARLQHANRQAA